jgi:hypothetical protein
MTTEAPESFAALAEGDQSAAPLVTFLTPLIFQPSFLACCCANFEIVC